MHPGESAAFRGGLFTSQALWFTSLPGVVHGSGARTKAVARCGQRYVLCSVSGESKSGYRCEQAGTTPLSNPRFALRLQLPAPGLPSLCVRSEVHLLGRSSSHPPGVAPGSPSCCRLLPPASSPPPPPQLPLRSFPANKSVMRSRCSTKNDTGKGGVKPGSGAAI